VLAASEISRRASSPWIRGSPTSDAHARASAQVADEGTGGRSPGGRVPLRSAARHPLVMPAADHLRSNERLRQTIARELKGVDIQS
jgi:hypothetical protein